MFFQSIASLVVAECACASLILTSFTNGPSLVCLDPRYLNWSTSSSVFSIRPYVGRWSWLDAVYENFAFVGADFQAVTSSSFLQSFSELLEFFAACKQNEVVSKPQIAEWRSPIDAEVSK